MFKRKLLCGGAFLFGGASLLSGQALAQDAKPAPIEEIVVTGSFIRGTPTDAALPVAVLSAEQLQRQGSPTTLELLKALPVSNGVLGETNQFDARARLRRLRQCQSARAWLAADPSTDERAAHADQSAGPGCLRDC